MINFYPGPSKVYETVADFAQEAFREGIVSYQHRSPEFVEISKNTIRQLKNKLRIPDDYWVFFTSSATECWEIIAQSLIQKRSFHIFNGAFGEKWFRYTEKLGKKAKPFPFEMQEEINLEKVKNYFPAAAEVICITQNETSNGTEVNAEIIRQIRYTFPDKFIALDATSSMGGIFIDFNSIDIAFASVQKCFGLPSGMAIMICSSQVIRKVQSLNENSHYNSLSFMTEKMQHWQTTHTPNILNIFLLGKLMQEITNINLIDKTIQSRAEKYYHFFEELSTIDLLVKARNIRSKTVISLKTEPSKVAYIKGEAKKMGIILGNGYGRWKDDTIRIANFPAMSEKEIKILFDFFEKV